VRKSPRIASKDCNCFFPGALETEIFSVSNQFMKRSLFLFAVLSLFAPGALPTARCASSRHSLVVNQKDISLLQDPVREKRERTAAQQKIDTQLLYALYRERGEAEAKGVPQGELSVKFDEKGRALVSIRAQVTKALLDKIKKLGGKIVSSSVRYNDIRAYTPLTKLEELAAMKEISAIMPAEEAMTNRAK